MKKLIATAALIPLLALAGCAQGATYGGFEKVGPLPWALPQSDEQVTAEPGDVMLYQGDQITIFTGTNSWAYTPLGHIEGATPESLIEALGDGDIEVTLSLG